MMQTSGFLKVASEKTKNILDGASWNSNIHFGRRQVEVWKNKQTVTQISMRFKYILFIRSKSNKYFLVTQSAKNTHVEICSKKSYFCTIKSNDSLCTDAVILKMLDNTNSLNQFEVK